MRDQELRDPKGRLLGTIRTRLDGTLEVRDPIGRLRGSYSPRRNETRDALGRLLGFGNLLAALIIERH
jgi:hypothetical protein